MSARRSDRLILAGLLILLFGVAIISFLGDQARQGQDELQGSSVNPAPPGALALYQWLDTAGYTVSRIQGTGSFAAALRTIDVLFVLNPQSNFTPVQIAAVTDWMDAGGV